MRDLYPPWAVLDDVLRADPAEHVAQDPPLGETVAAPLDADRAPAPLFRVWTNHRCLVVTRREQRLERFDAAAEASARRGWPVVTRDSGGTVVPHTRGTLLLTLILPRRAASEPDADMVYQWLCAPIIEALATLQVDVTYGTVPRSFCDGRYNLVVDGRKIAGTSQRWRGGLPGQPVRPGFVMAHLALYVAADVERATGAVNHFLRDAGRSPAFDPAAMTTVQAAAPSDLTPPSVWTLQSRVRRALLEVLRA